MKIEILFEKTQIGFHLHRFPSYSLSNFRSHFAEMHCYRKENGWKRAICDMATDPLGIPEFLDEPLMIFHTSILAFSQSI